MGDEARLATDVGRWCRSGGNWRGPGHDVCRVPLSLRPGLQQRSVGKSTDRHTFEVATPDAGDSQSRREFPVPLAATSAQASRFPRGRAGPGLRGHHPTRRRTRNFVTRDAIAVDAGTRRSGCSSATSGLDVGGGVCCSVN